MKEDDDDLDAIMAELQAEHEGKKAPPTAEELKVRGQLYSHESLTRFSYLDNYSQICLKVPRKVNH